MAKRKAEEPNAAAEQDIRDARSCHDRYVRCVRNNPSQAGRALCKMRYIACLIRPLMATLDSPDDEGGDNPKSR